MVKVIMNEENIIPTNNIRVRLQLKFYWLVTKKYGCLNVFTEI